MWLNGVFSVGMILYNFKLKNKNANEKSYGIISEAIGPTQVKCGLLISSIFYVMDFQHFSEMP